MHSNFNAPGILTSKSLLAHQMISYASPLKVGATNAVESDLLTVGTRVSTNVTQICFIRLWFVWKSANGNYLDVTTHVPHLVGKNVKGVLLAFHRFLYHVDTRRTAFLAIRHKTLKQFGVHGVSKSEFLDADMNEMWLVTSTLLLLPSDVYQSAKRICPVGISAKANATNAAVHLMLKVNT